MLSKRIGDVIGAPLGNDEMPASLKVLFGRRWNLHYVNVVHALVFPDYGNVKIS